jgi:hypothetical protein
VSPSVLARRDNSPSSERMTWTLYSRRPLKCSMSLNVLIGIPVSKDESEQKKQIFIGSILTILGNYRSHEYKMVRAARKTSRRRVIFLTNPSIFVIFNEYPNLFLQWMLSTIKVTSHSERFLLFDAVKAGSFKKSGFNYFRLSRQILLPAIGIPPWI